MPTATNNNTTPTRRSALGFSLAAFAAGLTVPALASASPTEGVASTDTLGADAELIALCNQLLVNETELWLLTDHDEYASDFGPNCARYEQLADERNRLTELIDECEHPVGAAGHIAMARVALAWVERDHENNVRCNDFCEEVMFKLAEGVAAGFIWPPRPGSCSTAHWAPPTSPKELAERRAAYEARAAKIDAKIEAERLAQESESLRRAAPSLLTDDELREKAKVSQEFADITNAMNAEALAEMARRGLSA
jgi:hypothetical protein